MRVADRLRDMAQSPYLADGYVVYRIFGLPDEDSEVAVLASSITAADRAVRVDLPVDPSSGLLDASAFRSWLVKMGTHLVGLGCSSVNCPLARWLHSVCSVSFFVDVDYFAFLDSLAGTFPLPVWACQFQTRCDAQFGFERPVPASAALALLNAVLAEQGVK